MRWDINFSYRRSGLVIDTNLFLLLLVGRYDRSKIPKFRATQKYNAQIFDLLESLVVLFRVFYTTPNVLTEVDNLSRQVSKAEWKGVSDCLSKTVTGMSEHYVPSAGLFADRAYPQIGLTDCSIVELAGKGLLVVTDDLALTVELQKRDLGVINLSRYLGL